MRKKNLCIITIIVSGSLFLPGCQSEQTKNAAPEILAEFAIPDIENGILLPVTFQGEKYQFVLDTGTTHIIFDDSFKDTLGKRFLWPKTMELANGKKIKIELFDNAPVANLGPLKLKCSAFIGVVDLDIIPGYDEMERKFQGLIGMDFLQKYIVQIDFDNNKVTFFRGKKDMDLFAFLKPKENVHPEWGEPIPLKRKLLCKLRYVKGTFAQDISDEFVIDSGLIGPDELKSSLFNKVPYKLTFGSKSEDDQTTAASSSKIDSKMVDKFSVGPFEYENRIFEADRKSTVGLWFLACHKVTFDFPNNVMYLKKGKTFDKPYMLDFSDKKIGLTINLSGKSIWVSKVDPNGPAYKKGIRQNDIISKIQVDDKILTSIDIIEFIKFLPELSQRQDATKIYTLKRGSETFTVSFVKHDSEANKD